VTTTSRFNHDADAICALIESFSIVEFVELVQSKLVVFVAFS
jgi:hypothetical protein